MLVVLKSDKKNLATASRNLFPHVSTLFSPKHSDLGIKKMGFGEISKNIPITIGIPMKIQAFLFLKLIICVMGLLFGDATVM